MDRFWAEIDNQLTALRSATTAEQVFTILGEPQEGAARAFFAGGGGDSSVGDSLAAAGWTHVMRDAHYYWCMRAPNGDKITYVEGDVYEGNQMLPHGEVS